MLVSCLILLDFMLVLWFNFSYCLHFHSLLEAAAGYQMQIMAFDLLCQEVEYP